MSRFLAHCQYLNPLCVPIATNISRRTICIPLPTHRLAHSAFRALQVDAELSPLVHRSFSLMPSRAREGFHACGTGGLHCKGSEICHGSIDEEMRTVLFAEYKATTNRMLRVAVNGFMESLGVVLGVMEELDVDMLR